MPNTNSLMMSDRVYNVLKQLAQIVLPALGTFYFAIAVIWGLAYGEEVIGTISAIDVMLGAFLGLSTKMYNNSDERFDGALDVLADTGDKKTYSLNLFSNPEELDQKSEIIFKVNPMDLPPGAPEGEPFPLPAPKHLAP